MAAQPETKTPQDPKYNYTPSHNPVHIKNHSWRTAENSAAYLIPTLQSMAADNPTLKLLDCGAGPGTLTASFSKYMPKGSITATDLYQEVLDQATAHAASQNITNITFQVADIYNLSDTFPENSFDIVHTHQVLCHSSEPLTALKSMLRVCKPGGVVAVRETDLRMWAYHPNTPGLEKSTQFIMRSMDSPYMGAGLVSLALKAGVPRANVTASFGTWCYSTPEEREMYGSAFAARARSGKMRERALERGLITEEELDEIAEAWEEWVRAEDGCFGCANGEILIRKP